MLFTNEGKNSLNAKRRHLKLGTYLAKLTPRCLPVGLVVYLQQLSLRLSFSFRLQGSSWQDFRTVGWMPKWLERLAQETLAG